MKEFSEKEFLLLAYLEGDLTEAEKTKVEAMLAKDAALMKEYTLLSKTILPANNVIYTSKANLKKPVAAQKVALGYLFWSGAIAACLAVLIVLYTPKTNNNQATALVHETNNPVKEQAPVVEPDSDDNSVTEDVTAYKNRKNSKATAQIVIPKTNGNKQAKAEIVTGEEPFNKKTFVVSLLNTKPAVLPSIELPKDDIVFKPNGTLLTVPTIDNEINKSWFARKTNKINNTLNTWVKFLEKPQIEISKKEPKTNGRIYWAITLEADEYEWEGRLYTRR